MCLWDVCGYLWCLHPCIACAEGLSMLKGTCLRAYTSNCPFVPCAQVWAGCACVLPVEVGRRETLHPCTDQHAVLWADPQLLACGSYPFFMLMRGSGGAAGPTSRNEEGPGDLGTEVVQDFRGVDQFQMAGGKPVTQHLEATEVVGLGVCVAGTAYHVAYLSLPTPEALDSGRGTQDLKGLCPRRTHRHGGGPCPPTGSD